MLLSDETPPGPPMVDVETAIMIEVENEETCTLTTPPKHHSSFAPTAPASITSSPLPYHVLGNIALAQIDLVVTGINPKFPSFQWYHSMIRYSIFVIAVISLSYFHADKMPWNWFYVTVAWMAPAAYCLIPPGDIIAVLIYFWIQLSFHNEATWLSAAASALAIAAFQAIISFSKLRMKHGINSTSPELYSLHARSWVYPITLLALLSTLSLLLVSTRAVLLMRWIVCALLISIATGIVVLSIQVALLLLPHTGKSCCCWRSSLCRFFHDHDNNNNNSVNSVNNNKVVAKILFVILVFTSNVSLLAATMVSRESVRFAFFLTSLTASYVSFLFGSFLAKGLESADTTTTTSTTKSIVAKGTFARAAPWQSNAALKIFLACAVVTFSPVLVTLLYHCNFFVDNHHHHHHDYATYPSSWHDDKALLTLQLVVFVTSLLLLPSYSIGIQPVSWNILYTTPDHKVELLVETVGCTHVYNDVVCAYIHQRDGPAVPMSPAAFVNYFSKRPQVYISNYGGGSCSSSSSSSIVSRRVSNISSSSSSSSTGYEQAQDDMVVVVVETATVDARYKTNYSGTRIYMTPDDPQAFLETMAQAVELAQTNKTMNSGSHVDNDDNVVLKMSKNKE